MLRRKHTHTPRTNNRKAREETAEEKQQGQVFTGKEVEKLGSKEKGITAMAIEEVLKSLVDDNEVMTDKIGTSNYYWAFASQERVTKQNRVDALTRDLAAQQARLDHATEENQRLLAERPDTVCP